MTLLRGAAGILLIAVSSLMAGSFSFAAAPSFSSGIQTGSIQNDSVDEASGIIASRVNANVLWTHNDSGNSPQVFPMTAAGANLGTYTISGASNVDWEDIAIGPGPLAGTQYLYIADTGDNGASRSNVSVYRVPEPVVSDLQSPVSTSVAGAVKFTFAYPDGARDAESMFVDPLSRDIYIISKRENPKHLYRAAYPQSTSGTTTLQLMATFLTDSTWLTAADISPNGNEIIIRSTESTSGRLYQRPVGGSITNAFAAAPTTIPLSSESQGEAIGFDPNGRGYYTTSEGGNPSIYYFNRLPPPAGTLYWDNDGVAAGSYIATGAAMGGSGTWNTSALKWYNGSSDVPWVGGNDAVFWGTAGTVTLSAGQTVNSLTFKSSGYLLTASTLTLGGSSVTVDSGVVATVSSTVSGSAGLAKNGNGTLSLTHANNYTGGTTINGGTLAVMNTTGSGTGTGPVTVLSGATFRGTGTIASDVSNNGTLAPGNSAGTLHVGGNFNQAVAGRLEIELASTSSYDELEIAGAASLAGTLAVSLTGNFMPQAGDMFEFVTASGFGGTTFSSAILPALTGDLVWNFNYGANSIALFVTIPGDFDNNGVVNSADYVVLRNGLGVAFTSANFDTWRAHFGESIATGAALSMVPEPMTWAPIGFGAALLLLGARRIDPRLPRVAINRSHLLARIDGAGHC